MLRYPHINPIAISLGPLHIHWYGIMYLVGFAAAWWLARRRARAARTRPGRPSDVDDFVFYAMLGVIIGGRIGYVLFYGLPLWRGDWLYPLKIWEGGMSFHGGLLGVLTAATLFARQRGRRVGDVFDFAAPLPGIGIFCGTHRQFHQRRALGPSHRRAVGHAGAGSQRRPGRGAPSLAAVRSNARGPGAVHHPVDLYPQAAAALRALGLFLICYSVARIAVEFVREPDVQLGYLAGGWFTMGQLLSLPMLVFGILLLAIAQRQRAPSGNFAPVA